MSKKYYRHMDKLIARVGKVLDEESDIDAACVCAGYLAWTLHEMSSKERERVAPLITEYFKDTLYEIATEQD